LFETPRLSDGRQRRSVDAESSLGDELDHHHHHGGLLVRRERSDDDAEIDNVDALDINQEERLARVRTLNCYSLLSACRKICIFEQPIKSGVTVQNFYRNLSNGCRDIGPSDYRETNSKT